MLPLPSFLVCNSGVRLYMCGGGWYCQNCSPILQIGKTLSHFLEKHTPALWPFQSSTAGKIGITYHAVLCGSHAHVRMRWEYVRKYNIAGLDWFCYIRLTLYMLNPGRGDFNLSKTKSKKGLARSYLIYHESSIWKPLLKNLSSQRFLLLDEAVLC